MLKIYVNENGLKMVGKAKDIVAKLQEYKQNHQTVHEFLGTKQQYTTKMAPYLFTHDNNSFTITVSKHKVPKHTQYYLLFPTKNKY